MKFKLTVLTLLVAGLLLGAGNVFAAASGVLELVANDNIVYVFDQDVVADVPVIPALKFKITNTGDAAQTITAFVLTPGAALVSSGSNEFQANIYKDVNTNGIVDPGDTKLTTAAGLNTPIAAAGATTVPLDGTGTTIAIGAVSQYIVTVNAVIANIINAEAVELTLLVANVNANGGVGIIETTTALLKPSLDTNTPVISFVTAAVVGTVTVMAEATLSDEVVGNTKSTQVVASFKLTANAIGANAPSHMISGITLNDALAAWSATGTPGTDVGMTYLYLDRGSIGAFDAADILLTSADLAAKTEAYTFTSYPVFLPPAAVEKFLLVFNFTGTAGVAGANSAATAKENLKVQVAAAGVIGEGAIGSAGPYNGPTIGLEPLFITKFETQDYNNDGLLEAIKVTFSDNITDSRWANLALTTDLWVEIAGGNNVIGADDATLLAFDPVLYGDVANNNVVYIKFNPSTLAASDRYTNGLPQVGIAAATLINGSATKTLVPFTPVGGAGAFAAVTRDAAAPIVYGATTGDANGNGKIDRITVTFSEPMSTTPANSFPGVTFSGSNSAFGVSGSYSPTSGSVSGSTIVYALTESVGSVYDTESTPTFAYSIAAGSLTDASAQFVECPEYGTGGLAQQSATVDNAPPVIIGAETRDNYTDESYLGASDYEAAGANGRIDTLVLAFSEAVTTVNTWATSDATKNAIVTQFTVNHPDVANVTKTTSPTTTTTSFHPAPTLVSTGTTDTASTLTIYLWENSSGGAAMKNGGDTGSTFTYTYAGIGNIATSGLKDAANNGVLDVGVAATSSDKSAPFIVDGLYKRDHTTVKVTGAAEDGNWAGVKFSNIRTIDSNAITAGSDYSNGDGFIDAFRIFFTEDVKVTDAVNLTGFAVSGLPAGYSTITLTGVDANGSGTVTTADNNLTIVAATGAVFYGTSSKAAGKYDTGQTPKVAFTSGAVIYDAATNALGGTGAIMSYDTAKPVPVKAVGSVGTKNIQITWSETVYEDAINTAFATTATPGNTVFGYHDNQVATTDAGAVSTGNIVWSLGTNTMAITTDNNLTQTDVEQDSLWVKFDLKVYDNADADVQLDAAYAENKAEYSTTGVGFKIIIDDAIKPWVVSATSVDQDGDGLIDHLRFVLSEDIDDATVDGYNGNAALGNDVSAVWKLSGYTGTIKFNFFQDIVGGTGAATVTTATMTAAYNAGEPVFVDNKPSDTILYARLDETLVPVSTSGMGSTDYAPTMTWVGQPTLSDKKPNTLEITTAHFSGACTDGVGPVLMAAQTISTTVLRATFSEGVKSSMVASGAFTWKLGTSLAGYQGYVAMVTFPSSGVVDLRVPDAFAWGADMGGTLGNSAVITDILSTGVAAKGSGNPAFANGQTAALASGVYSIAPVNLAASKTITVGATTIPGPATFVVTDVAADNGHFFLATFAPVTQTDVTNYQFYVKETDLSWSYFARVGSDLVPNALGKLQVIVPTPFNGAKIYGIVASTGEYSSSAGAASKVAGEIPVAELVEGAAKIAYTSVTPKVATGALPFAIDNIAPSALATFAMGDNAGAGAGVLVSWTAPADHGIVGQYGSLNTPIYGVDQYNIYRKIGTSPYTLVGTAPAGSVQFIDPVADGSTIYKYKIEIVDGSPSHTVQTAIRSAMAVSAKPGDFTGDNLTASRDFAIFAANYGTEFALTPTTFVSAIDLNGDGVVESSDFAIFATNYDVGVVDKTAASLPTSGVQFAINAESDPATSMFYVTVSADEIRDMAGLAFNVTYDASALEFVENSVNGTVGLAITKGQEGLVHVADMFVGEQFNGAITLGFKARGAADDLTFGVTGSVFMGESYAEMSFNGVEVTAKVAPTVYSLSKNYPNPFNPTTTIDYTIPEAGMVNLVIYNTAGQKVRTLVNQTQDAAYYKVVWDGRDDSGLSVASGIYFYRLSADKFSKIDKMTLLK